MLLSDFDYHLPDNRIAQTPIEPRDHSKLLVINRRTGQLSDDHFYELADLLTANDVLVVNDTKVFPARLFVQRVGTGHCPVPTKTIELLLEKEVEVTAKSITWATLTKPGLKLGDTIVIPNTNATGVCIQVNEYTREVKFDVNREQFFVLLDKWAKTPIPPYIHWEKDDEKHLRERYQTVYASRQGAVAAPTAGLHFTPELLKKLDQKGVVIEKVTLHVGLGTFLPVKTDDVTTHPMHSEWYELCDDVATHLNEAKQRGKRIIAVGTTTVRVLETCADSSYYLTPHTGNTQIFIYPPYQFKFVDALITNFHTPKSTLLMLVSAFVSAPNTPQCLKIENCKLKIAPLPSFSTFATSLMGKAYQRALENGYRFYSFGDAMLIE
ncbi:tRNA preQ1(34) S-adenosylmethionine ribosyltransferase-isomerase QueA [Candidatus Cerribacteria bacterium 'Amazon FNV 2010 28 9']|uniref:S-adenosylmethionine:tRNA ribosyltransferase-isomerase n=1 Tax=Candidatus Cerribacteria bacterium 'Amazon FNV 2010 28 9' TaxID=2081795 RepID=A0A317JN14_9BACT|nr:MAG: tRNA preQ1(34) S-adenosylmethionine ribosyltransferase-isomerase QueA [Candidatus Cerribacteria bacterium 'Amazon FNV 2010 28 9']